MQVSEDIIPTEVNLRLDVEVGNHSKSNPATSSTGPEKVRVLIVRICVDDRPVEKDCFHTHKVINSNPISIGLESDASAKQEASNTNRSSPRSEERPASAIESTVDVTGVITATDLQNGPVQRVTLGRADVGTRGEYGLSNLITKWALCQSSIYTKIHSERS